MKKTMLIAAASLLAHVAVARAQAPAPPPPAAPAESRRTGAITGRVVGEDGQAVADARVTVYAVNSTGLRATSLTVTTDADGNFRADGLAPAAYAVSAYLPGYVTPRPDATYYRLGETAHVTVRKGAAITGRVTDAGGEPVVGAVVQATLVRDEGGRQPAIPFVGRAMLTDDRGVYRLYGLLPGVYVVMATGDSRYVYGNVSPLEGDVPTYYPSATRDEAGEVRAGAGEEVSGIDIRHRGERGHVVSGKIVGQPVVEPVQTATGMAVENVGVLLIHAASGAVVGNAPVMLHEERRGFSFYGVADGEYEVVAARRFAGRDGAASSPRRVTVKGGDVTGLELTLAPLGSVAGRVVLEPRATGGGTAGGAGLHSAPPSSKNRSSHCAATIRAASRARRTSPAGRGRCSRAAWTGRASSSSATSKPDTTASCGTCRARVGTCAR
jgi:protocatechuate 3,4-dioxygenase beta subunit